jgi:hypothetical protein
MAVSFPFQITDHAWATTALSSTTDTISPASPIKSPTVRILIDKPSKPRRGRATQNIPWNLAVKKNAVLSRFSSSRLSQHPARWYRLRTKDPNDDCSLSFLCGIPQTRLDALFLECDFLRAHGTTLRVSERDISQFLEASVVGTELVKSQVNRGEKEYFLRIGTFGISPRFTAIEQFGLMMKSLQCPLKAGITFRQSLNEASETASEATEGTTEGTTEKTTEETGEKTTEQTTEGTAEKTTEGPTEPTLPWITLSCTGWSGEVDRKVIRLSTAALMQDTNTANLLPAKLPLCGSFRTRQGYNKLEIRTTTAANGQVGFVIRSKECRLEFPKEKISRKLCSSCGPLAESVTQIRRQARQVIN